MNENKTYQLIAAKLEQLPVPDMADMIWARIEAQLDIDLPPNDGNPDPGPAPTPKPVGKRIALGTATVALIIAIFQMFSNRKEDIPATSVLPINQNATPLTKDSVGVITQSAPKRTDNVNLTPSGDLLTVPLVKRDTTASTINLPDSTRQTAAPPKDTTLLVPPIVLNQPADSIPVKKKRGVSLNDTDYRIIPKKDSN